MCRQDNSRAMFIRNFKKVCKQALCGFLWKAPSSEKPRSLGYLRFVLLDTCFDFYIFEINILKCQTKTAIYIYMYIYYIYIYINILSYALIRGSDP
jgi:hypothetical protein